MLVSRMPFAIDLERVVEELFEITTQRCGIDVGELPTSIDQNIKGYCRSVEWSKLGDRSAAPGDRDPLAVRHAIDDIAAVVAEIPYRNIGHDHQCITGETGDPELHFGGKCRTAGTFKTTDCR